MFGDATAQGTPLVGRVFVINLERQPERWRRMGDELGLILDSSGLPLSQRTTRITAVDARDHQSEIAEDLLDPIYTLGDQLFVDPHPLASPERLDLDERIEMTPQEVAVASSHVEVWRRIAEGPHAAALVLEDDVWFFPGFARVFEQVWFELFPTDGKPMTVDMLYLSYREVRYGAEKVRVSRSLFIPFRGLWNLAGYVLSRSGAEKLIQSLPVRGPVDLWLNHQFARLGVYATSRPVVAQRLDNISDNSYSVLPVLSRLGIVNDETPGLYRGRPTLSPVFGFGDAGSGLSSLAMALSMLGYRCCSDIDRLPENEMQRLQHAAPDRVFDAYVNVSSLEACARELAALYPDARFIRTENPNEGSEAARRASRAALTGPLAIEDSTLVLRAGDPKSWKVLCEFLRCVPPPYAYPRLPDVGIRALDEGTTADAGVTLPRTHRMEFDEAPWVVPDARADRWRGIRSKSRTESGGANGRSEIVEDFRRLDQSLWRLRDDTFPANLALFSPHNFVPSGVGPAQLILRKEEMRVRRYSAAALSSVPQFMYGRFEATLRPAKGAGVVTGMFLHRDSPRQEIDVEFVGNRPRQILTNVYFNPGADGARFDYGFRGTPILVELGFDATEEFHRYAIEWLAEEMRWFVDGRLVHRRGIWDPTPIPHLPMHFHFNVWPCRSRELAGALKKRALPAVCRLASARLEPQAMSEPRLPGRSLASQGYRGL